MVDSKEIFKPSDKICVSGAGQTGHCENQALEKAKLIGKEIAERGKILVTGATTGIPYWSAKGAKEVGGTVVGVSPAASEAAHKNSYNLPVDYHDMIIYTGFNYAGRNLLLTRSSDAVLVICGRIGTLNEFTIGFEDDKPVGVLQGTGGTADMIEEIIEKAHRGSRKVVFSEDPLVLLDKVEDLIEKE